MASRTLFSSRTAAAATAAARSNVFATSAVATRALSTSSSMRLKESASSDPNPNTFEHHKQDSLSKQKTGKGHWKPELASDSEESVKADRMAPKEAGEAAMKRLQERTKEAAEETSRAGTSMKDHM